MEHITNNRLRHLSPLLFSLTLLVCLAACTRESEEPLYTRYASRPGLTVAQVCGFRLCDSVRADVVLLQADSDESWLELKNEFGIKGNEGMESWLGDRQQPATRVHWGIWPVTRVVASHSRHTVGLYLLETEEQYDALLDYQLGK